MGCNPVYMCVPPGSSVCYMPTEQGHVYEPMAIESRLSNTLTTMRVTRWLRLLSPPVVFLLNAFTHMWDLHLKTFLCQMVMRVCVYQGYRNPCARVCVCVCVSTRGAGIHVCRVCVCVYQVTGIHVCVCVSARLQESMCKET